MVDRASFQRSKTFTFPDSKLWSAFPVQAWLDGPLLRRRSWKAIVTVGNQPQRVEAEKGVSPWGTRETQYSWYRSQSQVKEERSTVESRTQDPDGRGRLQPRSTTRSPACGLAMQIAGRGGPLSIHSQSTVSLPSVLALCFYLSFLQKEKKKLPVFLPLSFIKSPALSPGPEKAELTHPPAGQPCGHHASQRQFNVSLAQHSCSITFTGLTRSHECGQVLPTPSPPQVFLCMDSSNITVQTFEQLTKEYMRPAGLWGTQLHRNCNISPPPSLLLRKMHWCENDIRVGIILNLL